MRLHIDLANCTTDPDEPLLPHFKGEVPKAGDLVCLHSEETTVEVRQRQVSVNTDRHVTDEVSLKCRDAS